MNILNITKSLHERINSATSLDEILILTKTIERLNLGTVKTVANYSDLLLEYPREGEVFFVENEEQLYYGFNGLWYLISRTATTIAYAWGLNLFAMLGDGTSTYRSSPVLVVGGFTDWSFMSIGGGVAAARSHTLGLRADGTIWAWGYNNSVGSLGDGTTSARSSPVSVVGGFTDWVTVSAGNTQNLALRSNGTLWAWGNRQFGQLGDGTVSNSPRSSPVPVVGGFTDWIQISAGINSNSYGLRSNGVLYGWGVNQNGGLGDGTTSSRSSPVSVIGITNWISAKGGADFCLAIRADSTLWAWGLNNSGQLGTNNTSNRSSPVSVVGGFTNWISVGAGNGFSIGLRSNGTLWSWGNNSIGQLGDNTVTNRSSPVSVVGGFTDWSSIAVGTNHTLAIRSNGTLWAWGNNANGQLGDNTAVASRSSPVSVVGGFTDWILATAQFNSAGLRSTT